MKYYSILIPIFNELSSIRILLESLKIYFDQGHEIILIDDGSKDGTTEILKGANFIKLIILNQNKGKGNAIREGLKHITNNKILIFLYTNLKTILSVFFGADPRWTDSSSNITAPPLFIW